MVLSTGLININYTSDFCFFSSKKRAITVAILCLSFLVQIKAQNNATRLHPIRSNHKTGYVKFYPEALTHAEFIAPKYDYVSADYLPYNEISGGKSKSPYRAFELDERVGLLDESLTEILPNDYTRIRVLSDNYFAVEQDDFFRLIDIEQNILLNGEGYENICIAMKNELGEPTHFFVQRAGKWGIVRMDGEYTIPPKHRYMLPAGEAGFFKVRERMRGAYWRVIDLFGQQVVPDECEDAIVLNQELIAIQHGTIQAEGRVLLWSVREIGQPPARQLEDRGEGIDEQIYLEMERLSTSLAVMVTQKGERVQLWDTARRLRRSNLKSEQRVSPRTGKDQTYPWFETLHGNYLKRLELANGRNESYRLLREDGRVSERRFNRIENVGMQDVFRVKAGRRWGFLRANIANEDVVRCQYDTVYNFQSGISICQLGNSFGAISFTPDTIASIPCDHKNPRIEDGRIWLQHENNIIAYRLDESNQFQIDSFVTGGMTFGKNTKQFRESRSIRQRSLSNDYETEIRYGLIDNRVMRYASDARDQEVGEMPREYLKMSPKEIISFNTAIFRIRQSKLSLNFGSNFPKISVRKHCIINFEENEVLSDSLIVGFRLFPPIYEHTTFVRNDGKMGLMNRKGEVMSKNGQPLYFTYIGEFKAGLARVYIGGELRSIGGGTKQIVPAKFNLGQIRSFMLEFNMDAAGDMKKQTKERYVYATGGRWAYIDRQGNIQLEPDAPYVGDFHRIDSVARFYHLASRKDVYGNPDADVGLMDLDGQTLVEAEYDRIVIEEGHFRVYKRGTPTYFFTQKGHQIFKNRTRLRPFSEGLAQFYDADKRWGYVNEQGEVIIEPQFRMARPFSDGRAMVVGESGMCAFIDTTGQVIFETKIPSKGHYFVGDFHDGRAWFKAAGKYIWGCYDKFGKVVIEPKIYHEKTILAGQNRLGDQLNPLQMDFSKGAAAVQLMTSSAQKQTVLIDTFAKLMLKPETPINIARLDANGIAIYSNSEKKKGILSAKDGILTEAVFDVIDTFQNKYTRVRTQKGWGILSVSGEMVIVPQYQGIGNLSEGLVAVKVEGQTDWQYVNTDNELAFEGRFKEASKFEYGVAKVVTLDEKGKVLYLNTNGEVIEFERSKIHAYSEGIFGIKRRDKRFFFADKTGSNRFVGRTFYHISPYQNGIAKVKPERRSKYGALNRRGVMILPPKYAYIHQQADGNIIVNPQSFMGLLDKEGNTILATEYDAIDAFNIPNFYRVESGEEVGYVTIQNGKLEWLWELQK